MDFPPACDQGNINNVGKALPHFCESDADVLTTWSMEKKTSFIKSYIKSNPTFQVLI